MQRLPRRRKLESGHACADVTRAITSSHDPKRVLLSVPINARLTSGIQSDDLFPSLIAVKINHRYEDTVQEGTL